MISLQQTKELLGEPNMSDKEAEKVRSKSYEFADLLFNRWVVQGKNPQNSKNKNENEQTNQIL